MSLEFKVGVLLDKIKHSIGYNKKLNLSDDLEDINEENAKEEILNFNGRIVYP